MAHELASVDELLKSIDDFFMGEGSVHKTMRALARRLAVEGIDYALAGGMALVLHGYRRETVDVAILLTPGGRNRLASELVGRGYLQVFPSAPNRFRDAETGVEIDVITTGEYPGDGKPKPISFPDPANASTEIGGIRVILLEKLIELKLASGMTAPHRLRDLADVLELIKLRGLTARFAERLDPYVRSKYLELWTAANDVDSSNPPE